MEPYDKEEFIESVKKSMSVALSHMLAGMESFVKGYDKIRSRFDWRDLPISAKVEEVLTERFCAITGMECVGNNEWWHPDKWLDGLFGSAEERERMDDDYY